MPEIPDKKDSNYFRDPFKLDVFDLRENYGNKKK